MAPDELIPRPNNELSLGDTSSNEITSRMAEDLLAIRKEEVLDDAVVHFKCENLEKALREKLDIPDRPITRRDLSVVTELDLNGRKITDISPLQSMTQLKELKLSGNEISDISPIQGMTQLTKLYLSWNQISDISPIQGMTQMTDLWLYGNNISDISPLQGMTQLYQLLLEHNQISDISCLHGMTQMVWLRLWNNQIGDSQIEMLKEALPDCRHMEF
jgi:Leucine-rich repeat (LRR) protein